MRIYYGTISFLYQLNVIMLLGLVLVLEAVAVMFIVFVALMLLQ
jgi:hypothetical protein